MFVSFPNGTSSQFSGHFSGQILLNCHPGESGFNLNGMSRGTLREEFPAAFDLECAAENVGSLGISWGSKLSFGRHTGKFHCFAHPFVSARSGTHRILGISLSTRCHRSQRLGMSIYMTNVLAL